MTTSANADELHFSCSEVSIVSPLFDGGISATRKFHRVLEVQLAADKTSVTVSNNYKDDANSGTFPLTVADSTYEWNGKIIYNNAYDHFILDRYTIGLKSVSTPVPGGKVIQMQTNYECSRIQKQI